MTITTSRRNNKVAKRKKIQSRLDFKKRTKLAESWERELKDCEKVSKEDVVAKHKKVQAKQTELAKVPEAKRSEKEKTWNQLSSLSYSFNHQEDVIASGKGILEFDDGESHIGTFDENGAQGFFKSAFANGTIRFEGYLKNSRPIGICNFWVSGKQIKKYFNY